MFALLKSMPEVGRGLRLAALHDPSEEAAEKFLSAFNPGAKRHTSYHALVEDPRVDWVMVGSWNCYHKEHVVSAFEAGKDVFCEKPLATVQEDCLAIREAYQKHNRRFFLGLVLRYSPLYMKVKELIDEGLAGYLISMEFNETLEFNHGGFIASDWRRLKRNAGPHILEKCVHDVDLAYWMTGSLPGRVASFGGLNFFVPENSSRMEEIGNNQQNQRAYQTWPSAIRLDPFMAEKDIVDNQVAILEYINGVRATLHTNLNAGIPERRMYICGSEGAIRADWRSGQVELRRIGFDEPTQIWQYESVTGNDGGGHAGADAALAAELSRCMLDEGAAPRAGVDEGLISAVTCFRLDESMMTGKVMDMRPTWRELELTASRA